MQKIEFVTEFSADSWTGLGVFNAVANPYGLPD